MKHEIKNVVVINDFDYIQGGASKVAIETANLLKREYPQLNIYFFSGCTSNDNLLDNKIVNISTEQGENLKDKNKIRGMINGIYNFDAKNKLNKLLKTLNKDETIIHVHGWTKSLSCSIFDVIFKKKYKLVVTLHDYFTACPNGGYFNYKKNEICHSSPLSWKCIKCNCDSRNYGFKLYRVIRQFVQNKIVKLNDRLENVITISEFSEKILKPTLGKNTKITRIYNPIDIDKNAEKVDPSKNEYYLYVGRICKEKGVDLFCQAITELGLKGIAVGDGDEKEKLEKQYPNIEFTGWKNKDEVKRYMKGARVLIFPSRWYETAGLTVLEAQNLKIPCIVNKNCAASEFIKENNNICTFTTIGDLKQKILKLGEANIEIFETNLEEFSYLNYKKKIFELFKQVV